MDTPPVAAPGVTVVTGVSSAVVALESPFTLRAVRGQPIPPVGARAAAAA